MSCALCPAGYANPSRINLARRCVKCAPAFNNVAQVATVGAEFGAKPLYAFDAENVGVAFQGCTTVSARVAHQSIAVRHVGSTITKTRQARFGAKNARTGI